MASSGRRWRWRVTYTKQLKQKRKVYQDGFLISTSTKVMLYDASEKLLECRLLKSGEVVRCGETLLFNAYLVDVGDLEPQDGHLGSGSSCSFGATAVDVENEKAKADKSRAGMTVLSPSQNLIQESYFRGLKRREINKYEMLSKSPGSVPTIADWHVLYTAQLTQETKKYHDGYLQLTNAGSLNFQVQLYDENWNLLDSRFMKKSEEVKPGEKLTFHAHVVEVVEPRGNHGNSSSSYTARNGRLSFPKLHDKKVPNDLKSHKPMEEKGKDNVLSSPKSNVTNGEPTRAGWQVLYTAQVTKKAKIYQDGFLQLTVLGSHGRQITLYDESHRVLNNRFLKKDELLQSGKSIAFDGHLVDIGAAEGRREIPLNLDKEVIHVSDKTKKHFNFNKPIIRQSIQRGQLADGNLVKASSEGDFSTNSGFSIVKEAEQTPIFSMRKTLRDTHQILSILRKPCYEEKGVSPSSDASKGTSAFTVKKPHGLENAMSDSSDDGSKPAPNEANPLEIVDLCSSEFAVGCSTESQLGQTLQVESLDKHHNNESNAQGSQSVPGASAPSHHLSHSGEESTFGPVKPDPEMQSEFPSFDLGF
ncbi:hypothetical protein MLD38_018519 [Melastoma candidum]|uniref:Uncharacterized protein n=1 Tax=Melastoma candidum TaxID=119954 RepID=A0ACB9QU87_9MYRT|nr:hypothetical protein MLD38_018519 [Melastoma candidum]